LYQDKLKAIEEKLRTRPMKCLDFKTPEETWTTEMQKQASKNTVRSCGGMMERVLVAKN